MLTGFGFMTTTMTRNADSRQKSFFQESCSLSLLLMLQQLHDKGRTVHDYACVVIVICVRMYV